ncbi:MAG: alpha/beta fold hydrolase [Chroococcidiopsidaceae cyanobacterium CP_BM_RX_35]|nr:alpha/beta fold hydrolase [Chroococcidiopsidaceae cyanobacterium CP_BM_RX_35]
MMPLQTPQDRYVQVGQINTRYWTLGDKGTAVILLHGLGSCVETWTFNISVLAQQHRVYAVDLVGAGRSDKPASTYSLSYLAQFVKGFMDALRIESACLIGNSLGGGIALQYALDFPRQVERLVLVSSFGLGKEITFTLRLATLPFVEKLFHPSRSSIALALKQSVYDSTLISHEQVELYYQIGTLPGAWSALLALIKTNIDLFGVRTKVYYAIVDKLTTITAPTLVLWGRQDRVLPVAHATIATKRLPNVRLHIFERCGHWSQFEYSEEFNSLVLEFLADQAV